jgi:hypothetical protein
MTVVERKEAAAGVVEDAVEDHTHAPGVGRVEQRPQRRVATEHGVDGGVVVRVVAVVARRREDRVQVDGRDAQVGQVVEAVDEPQQVAPLVAVHRRRRRPRLEPTRLRHAPTAGEPIREHLVEHRMPNPIRGIEVEGHGPS